MITIHKAGKDDVPKIVAFNRALAEESEHRTLDEETLTTGVTRFLTLPEQGFYSLAELDGEIVGQVMITTEFTDWRNGVMWWIQSVYVKPEFRRRGIYRVLHEHITELARKDNAVRGLRLYVHDENSLAQKTYENLGMEWSGFRLMERDFVLPPAHGENESSE